MELKNVNKSYRKNNNSITIFEQLNIKFCLGSFYAIIGKSGAGKSTLISMLGLLDSYQDGDYLIDGASTRKLNDAELSNLRMKKIGLIFQDYYLNPRLTAYENVLIATLINPLIEPHERKKIVLNYLKKLNIYERRNHYPSELSGGEQQRVCIARALVNNPSYILADEPTGSLDPENAKIIMNILKKLCDEGKCVIMVTHDMSLVSYANYLYKLENHSLKECK